ncbi:MAG: MaoC family dehydratase N-terminal domain-containing protein [Rubrivivax sp.]|nr:MaoC family dehydratase N-terminal domain-containing protein [Rubrivivax sp.]
MAMELEPLRRWVGRSEMRTDHIGPTPVRALAATLDHAERPVPAGLVLPPLAHWLYFLPLARASEIGPDGHAKRGGFLPPVPLPRRMWAGGQLEFRAPLRVGDAVPRRSTIADVSLKEGRSGALVFVKVRHEVHVLGAGGAEGAEGAEGAAAAVPPPPALVELHDIVYRGDPVPGEPAPEPQRAPEGADWTREIVPDDVLLFRYSALTFNGHRIHYDRRYVTEVEGYPGLVVHGPLIATLLTDLLVRHRPDADLAAFRFKAVRPTFDGHPFKVHGRLEGRDVKLWAEDHEGWLTMDAHATLR